MAGLGRKLLNNESLRVENIIFTISFIIHTRHTFLQNECIYEAQSLFRKCVIYNMIETSQAFS